ncbi:MAG TPA: glycosyltransferase family A protein [Candidatus Limnocylindrales bacterium]|nr:glycosyltransferase family A protein [Candidatus Limnocylindrales bacterium]
MNRPAPVLDVLIPTYCRPAALAVTLAGLVAQTLPAFRVVVSDQTDGAPASIDAPEVESVARVLEVTGRDVELHRHLPRRGMAEHRAFLLSLARAPYALFLDDDVLCEGDLLERLLRSISDAACGFVGSGLVGASFAEDRRPEEQAAFEPWPDNRVLPEAIEPESAPWSRYRLHNAANLHHLRERVEARTGERPPDTLYKVAWIGGCVLYDVEKLREAGGFDFWRDLPPRHAGEDVLAQLRLMRRYGGAGLFPSGAYHLELPTTLPDREVDAPRVLQP